MEQTPTTFFEKLNIWIKESITLKLVSIGILIIILLIPQSQVGSLIWERERRANEVISEIASKWSGQQTLTGPVIVIPFMTYDKIDNGKDGIRIVENKKEAFFLSESLDVNGTISPEVRHRGIFEAAVYASRVAMTARFLKPDFERFHVADKDILWNESRVVMGISDLRGISQNPRILMGNDTLSGEPSNDIGISPVNGDGGNYAVNGISVLLPWKSAADFTADASFSLDLKGSERLFLAPVGKTTTMKLSSPWQNPSFDGEFLPDHHEITTSGFTADWKVLHYNRPFTQTWTTGQQSITNNNFGVKLLIPVEQYQKSVRTSKYGVLVILLTFVSLFMVEIIRKIRVHPVQYILVGAALIIYYVLLLSLSEHIGYNLAYLIASVVTIALVSAYSTTFLDNRKTVLMLAGWMTLFYTFIFVIIQEQDYSLLIGSIGLFVIIGGIMYFSRRVRWYRD